MALTKFPNGVNAFTVPKYAEKVTGNKTLNATTDVGKSFYVTSRNAVITLPALSAGALYIYTIINGCDDGASALAISPNAADGVSYITQVDDKDIINTAATSRRGDQVVLSSASLGVFWVVTAIGGVWAKEA